jgi:tetratricopeptide (TPR) repeat protein
MKPRDEALEHGTLELLRAERLLRTGDIVAAEKLTRDAWSRFRNLGDERMVAMAARQIADILSLRGEHDEALRIHREEELPVFERVGDARDRALTMGRIADVLALKGDFDEALRIRREEELPVYEQLGDLRERAVTLQKIADAMLSAGGLEQGRTREIIGALSEAFGIARRLGFADLTAYVGMQSADVLAYLGSFDTALDMLDHAEASFRKLKLVEELGRVDKMREAIRNAQQSRR